MDWSVNAKCGVINVGTDASGTYDLGISLDYSIGSDSNRITVGKVPGMIGFFDFDKSFTNEALR